MIKASLRGLLQRKLRLALALIAIVLSVTFLSTAMVLTSTLNARFGTLFSTINQNIAVQVQPEETDNQEPPLLTEADLDRLADVDGVRVVQGDVSAEGVIPFRSSDGKAVSVQSVTLGAGVTGEDELGLVELADGALPQAAGEVAVSQHTAKLAGVAIGDQLKVFVPRIAEAKEFEVVGTVAYSGGRDSLAGETLVLFEQTEAQQLFYGKTGVFGAAALAADEGVSQDELKRRVSEEVPAGFEAKTGDEVTEEQSSAVSEVFSTLSNFILMPFVVIAAFVGVFLIYNTFNIVVAQRARELALLRALGAGWGQVTLSVLLEAIIVGAVGATIGLGAGIGLGALSESVLSGLMGLDLPSGGIVVTGWAILLSYLVGVLVTVIAAFIPAIKAATVPPIAAMREVARPDKSLKGLSITGSVFALIGTGLVALALTGLGSVTLLVLGAGVLTVFLGAALLSPLLSKPVVRLLGKVVGRGQPGRLGVRNALRNPRRTAVTAAALMIGVMVISLVGVIGASFKATIEQVVSQDMGADIIIQAGGNAEPGKTGFDPGALDEVRALPGVSEAVAWHISGATVNGTPNFVSVLDLERARSMFALTASEGELRTLAGSELVVDDITAKDSGWTVGEQITIGLPKGEGTYTVVGLYERTPVWQGIVLGEPAVADLAGPLAFNGFVKLKDGADAAATTAAVEEIMSDYPMVTVGDQSDYIAQQNAFFDIALGVVTVLLGVALLIALLGILNTLLLSIVERTRELGLVRAIGLSRGGVMRMVTAESVLIAVFGCLLGMVLGIGLGAMFVKALIDMEFITVLALPWTDLATYLIIAVVAGVVAALWPARRAARLNVLDAIAYE